MEALSENFGWIEIVFTALVAFGFGGYQLWSVNREIERDKQKKREADFICWFGACDRGA